MLKSTTNADCPYFFIQGYLSSLEFNHRAALAVIIKVIKELVCRHDFSPSLCRFGLGLSMKNKKSAILLCPSGTTNADWPYFCYSENLILLLGFHKSRAVHSKVIIIKLVHKHGYSSFVVYEQVLLLLLCYGLPDFCEIREVRSGFRNNKNTVSPHSSCRWGITELRIFIFS